MFRTIARGGRAGRALFSSSHIVRVAGTVALTLSMISCATSDVIVGVNDVVDGLSISVDPPTTSPSEVSIGVGESVVLSATAVNALGLPVGEATVTWSSEDAAVASVSAGGVVVGVSPGATRVIATTNGVAAALPITVRDDSVIPAG